MPEEALDTSTEDRARLTGWVPEGEFKGDPERWSDAETWNNRTDEIMPILKSTNKRLETELGATQKEIVQLKQTMKKMAVASETITKRAYDKAVETIQKEQKSAINEQDGEKWEELEKQKKELEESKPEKVDTSQLDKPVYSQLQNDFFSRNASWYGVNKEMTAVAYAKATEMANQGASDEVQLAEAEKRVKEMYPEMFENSRRSEETVSIGEKQPKKPGKKSSFESLPQEAKDMYVALKRDDPDYKKEQYLKDYLDEV